VTPSGSNHLGSSSHGPVGLRHSIVAWEFNESFSDRTPAPRHIGPCLLEFGQHILHDKTVCQSSSIASLSHCKGRVRRQAALLGLLVDLYIKHVSICPGNSSSPGLFHGDSHQLRTWVKHRRRGLGQRMRIQRQIDFIGIPANWQGWAAVIQQLIPSDHWPVHPQLDRGRESRPYLYCTERKDFRATGWEPKGEIDRISFKERACEMFDEAQERNELTLKTAQQALALLTYSTNHDTLPPRGWQADQPSQTTKALQIGVLAARDPQAHLEAKALLADQKRKDRSAKACRQLKNCSERASGGKTNLPLTLSINGARQWDRDIWISALSNYLADKFMPDFSQGPPDRIGHLSFLKIRALHSPSWQLWASGARRISLDLLLVAIASASANSTPASDDVSWEVLKALPMEVKLWLCKLFNRVILSMDFSRPSLWKHVLLAGIPNVSDALTFAEFRWIGIASVLAKLFGKCLSSLQSQVDKWGKSWTNPLAIGTGSVDWEILVGSQEFTPASQDSLTDRDYEQAAPYNCWDSSLRRDSRQEILTLGFAEGC